MRINRKVILLLVGIIFVTVAIVIAEIIANMAYKKDIDDEKQERKEYLNSLFVEDGRNIDIDGYMFTILRQLYDEKTSSGCCQIKVTGRDNTVPDISIDQRLKSVEIDNRFEIFIMSNSNITYEVKGNNIILNIFFVDYQGHMENKIKIFDYKDYDSNDDSGEVLAGEFGLRNSNCSVQFNGNNGEKIYISPFVIREEKGNKMNFSSEEESDLIISLKNGKKIQLMKNGEIQEDTLEGISSVINNTGYTIKYYNFKDVIVLSEIDYIIVDDEKLNKVEE